MSKSSIVIIVYVVGLIIGALFLDLWSAETSIKKALLGMVWTAFFLIALLQRFYCCTKTGRQKR